MGLGFYGLKVIVLVADLIAALCALLIANMLRYPTSWQNWPGIGIRFSWFMLLYMITFVGLMYYYENYRFEELPSSNKIIKQTAKAHLFTLGLAYMYIGLLKLDNVSRLIILGLVVIQYLLAFSVRILLRFSFKLLRRRGYVHSYMLVIGGDRRAQKLIGEMKKHPEYTTRIVGVLDDRSELTEQKVEGIPVLGKIRDIAQVFYDYPVDEVFISLGGRTVSEAQDLMSLCRLEGKSVHLLLEEVKQDEKFTAAEIYGLPTLSILPIQPTWARFRKRVFDFGVSGMALIVLSPLLLTIALLIKVTSPGPVFFIQERIGLNGRRIHIYKFRTMVANAEELKEQFKYLNEVDGPVFKIKHDPRITTLGRFLRKTSLDELPQLINVFTGQMSLVGPRPLPTKEALQCTGWHRKRMAVKPGLTCTWQVSGRNEISFDEWMKMDTFYIDHWSFWLDLRIILKTVPEVLGMHGM